MIRINLLPAEERARVKDVQLTLPAFNDVVIPVAALVLVAGTVGGTAIAQTLKIRQLEESTKAVEEQSRALQPTIERVNRLAQEKAELDLRLGIIHRLEGGRTRTVQLLDEAAKCIPNYLWLTAMNDEGERMSIEGSAFSPLAVSDLMSKLEQSPQFGDVELDFTERTRQGNSDVMKFRVSCRITPEAQAN